ncbi:helix-turn-helix transcriptional regulator [Hymenobacter sp. BT770]|uniref:helix-turn-helix domain-containing protein n=1 Tax=Hymenobacter sp. BT770 TaxID=2886942 RepID=UPI001D0F87FC|nr:helix-turn-helix domain-containing protein [Hymenobacter sp. BT770]MCC3152744.1 AraC family transcriptional regulator [Hymenobacter sp. BT770]MDO3414817.1 helix-turn-helix transcriptional regulator [Hymenobacter sp. BT770]
MKAVGPPVLALASFPPPLARTPYYCERLETHVVKFPHVNVPHAHDFYLLLYITAGTGTHTVDLVTYKLRPGSLFFLAPGQVHHWQLATDVRGFVVFFDTDFYLFRYPGNGLYRYPFFDSAHPPLLHLPPQKTEIRPLFEHLFQEYQEPHPNQAEVFRTYLHLGLELAARHYPAQPTAEVSAAPQQIRAFGALLNQHFRTKHSVSEYADLLHLTANHLNALCRRVLNKTASALIHERVVVEAQRLLSHSALSVAQVAYELGFEDASYFVRYFRKYTGTTPEAFRQR